MRTDPARSGPETVLIEREDLSAAQLAQPVPTSGLTLGGLLNHLALVEDTWFRMRFLGLERVPPWHLRDSTAATSGKSR